jgi:acyl-ACP thioesterase
MNLDQSFFFSFKQRIIDLDLQGHLQNVMLKSEY